MRWSSPGEGHGRKLNASFSIPLTNSVSFSSRWPSRASSGLRNYGGARADMTMQPDPFEQVQNEPLAQLGQATLALERGDAQVALEWVERCLRRLPSQDRMERLPALELHIRACLLQGDCDKAREVVPELEEMMRSVATRPLQASVKASLGLIAAADERLEEARVHLEDAADTFDQCGAPFEAGRARLELARVLAEAGRTADATVQASTALAAFEALGARGEASRARALVESLTVRARPQQVLTTSHGLTCTRG